MTQITKNLHVTGIDTVREESTSQFGKVVTVCQENVSDNVSCEYSYYNMSDGESGYGGVCEYNMFKSAANEVYQSVMDNQKTLVHCHVGRSRSVSIATAVIARGENISRYTYALNKVKDKREQASPNNELIEFIKQYINEYVE